MRNGVLGITVLGLCVGVSLGQQLSSETPTPTPTRAEVQLPQRAPKASSSQLLPGGDATKKPQTEGVDDPDPDPQTAPRAEVRVPAGASKRRSSQVAPPVDRSTQQLPRTLPAPPTDRVLPGVSKSGGAPPPTRLPGRAVSRAPASQAPVPDDSDRAPLALPPSTSCVSPTDFTGRRPASRFWAEADYLHWWVKSGPVAAPLLVAGSPADAIPGALGQPGTRTLIDQSLNYPSMNGYRIGAGFWLDSDQRLGIEAHFFDLLQSNWGRVFQSGPATPLLARPIADTTGAFHVLYASFPGTLQGGFSVGSTTQLSGYDINLRGKLLANEWLSISATGGFRYLNLAEDLQMVQQSSGTILTFNGVPLPPGSTIGLFDTFQTQNQFFGGQVGTRVQGNLGRWVVGADAKLGIGENMQSITINGLSVASAPGGPVLLAPGGSFAQLSNMGHYTTSHFALVPEFATDIGYQITPWMRLRLGYNFLFWSNVLRPGAQIDPTLNVNNVPVSQLFGTLPGGPARPSVLFNRSEFWAQGVSVGLLFSY
jgi:hypothetical protein